MNVKVKVNESWWKAGRPVLTTTGTPWGATRSPIRMRIRIKEDGSDESMNLKGTGVG